MKIILLHEKYRSAGLSKLTVTDAEAARVRELYEQAREKPFRNEGPNCIRMVGVEGTVSFAPEDVSSLHVDEYSTEVQADRLHDLRSSEEGASA